ncbi:hypothetical protein pipiens_017121 [Culex pipiens pipiens]|uniref:Uncharacterized protein n=1 Tax=Culex pipiens pipiens TaxID=38569 RepID=A0ABD1CI79_CULPP
MDSNWNLLVSADAQKTVKYDEEPGRAWPAAPNATSDLLAILGYFRKDSKHRRPRRQRPGPHARRHAPVLPATPPRPCRFVDCAASQRTRPLTGIWKIARAKNKDVYATCQMMLAQDVDGQKQQIDAAECQWK